jgi:hypothetical protein
MHDATLLNAFYLAWSLPLVAALAVATLAPERAARLVQRIALRRGTLAKTATPA